MMDNVFTDILALFVMDVIDKVSVITFMVSNFLFRSRKHTIEDGRVICTED